MQVVRGISRWIAATSSEDDQTPGEDDQCSSIIDGSRVAARDRRVASADPRRTSTNPTSMPNVNGSLRKTTPRTTATAGLMYVITVARTGPASSISLKKIRNATAVQSTPSTTIEMVASAGGQAGGRSTRAGMAYSTIVMTNDAATTPSCGRSARYRVRMNGPTAYPTTTAVISSSAPRSSMLRSRPTSAATPPKPMSSPI